MSKAAQERYDKKNTIFVGCKFNRNTDKEIVEAMEKTDNKQGLIKVALNEYLKNKKILSKTFAKTLDNMLNL